MADRREASSVPIIRQARLGDLAAIVDVHLRNFHENELSVLLGRRYVERFYDQALQDPDVNLRVVDHDGHVVALSVIFFRYSHFEAAYRRRVVPLIVRDVLAATFALVGGRTAGLRRLAEISKTVRARHTGLVPAQVYDFHLGNIAIDVPFRRTPAVILSFAKMFEAQIALLRSRAPGGFWTSARASNGASLNFIRKYARPLSERAADAYPEKVVIFCSEL